MDRHYVCARSHFFPFPQPKKPSVQVVKGFSMEENWPFPKNLEYFQSGRSLLSCRFEHLYASVGSWGPLVYHSPLFSLSSSRRRESIGSLRAHCGAGCHKPHGVLLLEYSRKVSGLFRQWCQCPLPLSRSRSPWIHVRVGEDVSPIAYHPEYPLDGSSHGEMPAPLHFIPVSPSQLIGRMGIGDILPQVQPSQGCCLQCTCLPPHVQNEGNRDLCKGHGHFPVPQTNLRSPGRVWVLMAASHFTQNQVCACSKTRRCHHSNLLRFPRPVPVIGKCLTPIALTIVTLELCKGWWRIPPWLDSFWAPQDGSSCTASAICSLVGEKAGCQSLSIIGSSKVFPQHS